MYEFLTLYSLITLYTNVHDIQELKKIKKYINSDLNDKNAFKKITRNAYCHFKNINNSETINDPIDKIIMNFIPFLNVELFINRIRKKESFKLIRNYYDDNKKYIKKYDKMY